jgi:hypothetical protein
MNYPYDLHSWSKHYREEAMAKATNRHLAERAMTDRKQRELQQVGLGLENSSGTPASRGEIAA